MLASVLAKILVAVEEIEFDFGGDAVGAGQYNGYLVAYDKATGKKMGYLDWSYYQDEHQISMVEVMPEFRGQGVAEAIIMEFLKREDLDYKELSWSMTTSDGTKLKRKLDQKYGATTPAVYSGWSCPEGPAELVDWLVDHPCTEELTYDQFAAVVDVSTANLDESQIEILPTDWAVTFLKTELPDETPAWVMQHSGIEQLFLLPGDIDKVPGAQSQAVERIEEIYVPDTWTPIPCSEYRKPNSM